MLDAKPFPDNQKQLNMGYIIIQIKLYTSIHQISRVAVSLLN